MSIIVEGTNLKLKRHFVLQLGFMSWKFRFEWAVFNLTMTNSDSWQVIASL